MSAWAVTMGAGATMGSCMRPLPFHAGGRRGPESITWTPAMAKYNSRVILEQLAQARDQTTWDALMAPALAQLNCRVIQSTSDEAPGLLAYVEHYLEAHHSPDLFHVQHELVKAVSGPMATKERAAHKAVTEAQEQLERLQTDPQNAGDEPEKR